MGGEAWPHNPIETLLAYPNDLFRQALVEMIRTGTDVQVTAVTTSYNDVAAWTVAYRPDVVLLGFDDQVTSVAEIGDVLADLQKTRVAVFATLTRPGSLAKLIKFNAAAYLINSINREELLFTLRSAASGANRRILLAPNGLITELGEASAHQLSNRELDVLRLLAMGMTNRQIGSSLFITEGTIKRHLHSIYRKLDACSRTDAVRRALVRGLLAMADITSDDISNPRN